MMPAFPIHQVFMKTPDQDFWESVFHQLIDNSHDPEDAAKHADAALALWRERWPQDKRVAGPMRAFVPISTDSPHPSQPSALERLVEAQNGLDAARKQLEAVRNLSEAMPEEIGKPYYDVAAPMIQKQLEYCEQWVRNIQDEIERSEPAPPASGGSEC